MSYITASNFSVYQKQKRIVNSVNFSADKGELVALLGLNASGKTTLIKGICALLKTQGECVINSHSNLKTNTKTIQSFISYIPQRHNIAFHISALEIVLTGFAQSMKLFDNYTALQKEAALNALSLVDMGQYAATDFMTLSEGQKQLVILARALVQNNDLLIFDEPDSAMDFNNKHLILSKVRQIVTQQKCGILCLHDANFALRYCDKALIMKNGEIVFELNIKSASKSEILHALNLVYGNIKIVKIDGFNFMLKA